MYLNKSCSTYGYLCIRISPDLISSIVPKGTPVFE